MYFFWHLQPWVAAAIVIGWLSHSLIDGIGKQKVQYFWPLKGGFCLNFVSAGHGGENYFIFPLAILANIDSTWNGDTSLKWLKKNLTLRNSTFGSVLLVALFAAIVSYTHIRALGIRFHYDAFTASLLPLSIDGLIVGSGLMLAQAGRERLRASVARTGLWLGICATIAANVAYGLPQSLTGIAETVVAALVCAWPAVCFIVIVEAWMQLLKKVRNKRKPATATTKRRRRTQTAPPESEPSNFTKEFDAKTNLPSPNGKPVTAYKIRKETGCNQAKAAELAEIMNNDHVDLATALQRRGHRREGIKVNA